MSRIQFLTLSMEMTLLGEAESALMIYTSMVVSIVRFTIRIVRYETIQQLHDTNRLMNRFGPVSCSYRTIRTSNRMNRSDSIRIVAFTETDVPHNDTSHDCDSCCNTSCSGAGGLSRGGASWPLSWQPLSRWLLLPWCLSLPRKG